ncbi:trichoplein keratin filament-binding protein [Aulostomus maculatus]
MALPTLSSSVPSRPRMLVEQFARQREQEARLRQQWELHAHYFREQNVRSQRQAAWSSHQSLQRSMSAYHHQRQEKEKTANLEQRRNRLRIMLEEELNRFEAELKALVPDRSTLASQMAQQVEALRSAREEMRKKVAQDLLKEHWKLNNPELRQLEFTLHKDHVVSCWQEQVSEKKQQEAAEQEEKKRFENEYEKTRKLALERIREAEERKKAEQLQRAEDLCKQMEELKLREQEATRLKKAEEGLRLQQLELEKVEEERREVEERRKNSEMRHFLIRQYRAQLKRRAQQVQEELESDRKIMAALMAGEDESRRNETARRERAIADAAWMKAVIEEQLQLEREREAELEFLHREDAQKVWEKREAQWEKERKARQRLMQEVLLGRQQQLELKLQRNREAQEESLMRREELIQELEEERALRHLEREQEEGRRTDRMQEINAQMEQQLQQRWEEQRRVEQEEEEDREALRIQEEELNQEMQRMTERGYQEKIRGRPRSAWT